MVLTFPSKGTSNSNFVLLEIKDYYLALDFEPNHPVIIKADNEKTESSGFLIVLKYHCKPLLHLLAGRCCNEYRYLCNRVYLFKCPLSLTWMLFFISGPPMEDRQKDVTLEFKCMLLSRLMLLNWGCCLVSVTEVLSVLPKTSGLFTGDLWKWEQCGMLTRTVKCCYDCRLILFHSE